MTMHIRQFLLTFLFLSIVSVTYGQKKFKVVATETDTWVEIFSLIDENGKLIRQLDTSKYLTCFNTDQYVHFAIFGMKAGFNKGGGWAAIDANETILFNVYNTSFGEPSPDYLIENKIRIIDTNNLIGFANNKGQIIIKPQFEIVSSFHKGKAIVGQTCKKVPWDAHAKESDCHHYSIICERHGYIDTKGKVLKMGDYSFEDVMKQINWKMHDE